MSKVPSARKLQRAENKALRAWALFQRGHSLEDIAALCDLSGSARRQVDLGERLASIGRTQQPLD